MRNFDNFGRLKRMPFILLFVMSCMAADLLPSWDAVRKELSGESSKEPFETFWTNSAILRRLVAERNTNSLLELAGQPDVDTSMAAFFALRTFDLKSAQNLGLQLSLRTSVAINPFVIHVMESLSRDLPNADFRAALTAAFGMRPVASENADLLIQMLPEAALKDWFEDPTRAPSFLTYEALVLNRLFLEHEKRREPPTPKMTATLESYVNVPGIPRLEFVFLTRNRGHPLFKKALYLCLQDESIPDSSWNVFVDVAVQFRLIDETTDLRKLRISDERRKTLVNALVKANRNVVPPK